MNKEIVPLLRSGEKQGLESMPMAIEVDQPFDVAAFKERNPQFTVVEYIGPREHLTQGGTKHPTHFLSATIGDNPDFRRRVTISDYRGKTSLPHDAFTVEYKGRVGEDAFEVFLGTGRGDVPSDRISGINGLPAEFNSLRGLQVAVFSRNHQNGNMEFQYNTNPKAEDVLRRMLVDLMNMDFSESPLLPLRNMSRDEVRRIGKAASLPPLPDGILDIPSTVI